MCGGGGGGGKAMLLRIVAEMAAGLEMAAYFVLQWLPPLPRPPGANAIS